jgi:cytochrome P450
MKIRQCIGQMVARLEAQALLKAIIPPVREIRLAGKPVRWLNNTLHALASLPIELAGN